MTTVPLVREAEPVKEFDVRMVKVPAPDFSRVIGPASEPLPVRE